MEKEILTVEFLPSYNQYRVWNTWTESWFGTWEDFVRVVKRENLTAYYDFVSYGDETRIKLNELLKVLNEEEMK